MISPAARKERPDTTFHVGGVDYPRPADLLAADASLAAASDRYFAAAAAHASEANLNARGVAARAMRRAEDVWVAALGRAQDSVGD